MECHNKVFDSKRCALSAQAVYFLHSTCSVTCLRLSDVSVICRVTYFQFQFQVCISPMSVRQAAERLIGLRNIGYRTLPKIWVGTFLYAAYSPEEWFWIDYSGKIETRHPIEGYFCVFFGKTTPYVKFSKFCLKVLTASRSTFLCSNFVKCCRREIAKSYVIYRTKNRLPLKLSLLRGSRPKSARANP